MAIEKYELRIGNIITGDIDGTPGRILQLFDECAQWTYDLLPSNSVGYNSTTYNYISGIPLSPELLEKCGFTFSDKKAHFTDGYHYYDFAFDKEKRLVYLAPNTDVRIAHYCDYLHELQNLYWCLCRKELPIQL